MVGRDGLLDSPTCKLPPAANSSLPLPQCNALYCRALISSLTRGGKLDTAFDVLDWMAEDGVRGNAIVYQTLINACLEADEWDKVCQGRAKVVGGLPCQALPPQPHLVCSPATLTAVGPDTMPGPFPHLAPPAAPVQALSVLPRMKAELVWFTPDSVSRLTRFCSDRGQPRVAFNLFKARCTCCAR